MNKIKVLSVIFFLLLFPIAAVIAQPFASDIASFKKQDSISFPPANKILFIGSSSFTLWKNVQEDFSKYKMLNRAFGGSQLTDIIRYRYEVIYPYQPKQIVMYCGENDFAASDTVTVDMVTDRFKALFMQIRAKYPKVPFAYVSMKPSPSRKHLMKKYEMANELISLWLKEKKKTKYIDVFHSMLNKEGQPMDDIFLDDKLHMNAKGYAIWKKLIEPVLIK